MAIDTNNLERTLRLIPLGRRSQLFYGSELGARQVGIIQWPITTGRPHNVDPGTHLTDVLQRMTVQPGKENATLTPRL